MSFISEYRCHFGYHSWMGDGEKICKDCNSKYGRKKCRFGIHIWEGEDKEKFCKFCEISNQDNYRFGYIGMGIWFVEGS